jgi:hypothetical protein
MYFVYEEYYLPLGFNHFLDDSLKPFLELSLILRTRDKCSHVKGLEAFALEVFGHLAVDDLGGQSLGYGGLAHAGFAHQDRVVLGSPGEYLQYPADLFVTAYHRVQPAFGSRLGEVDRIFA